MEDSNIAPIDGTCLPQKRKTRLQKPKRFSDSNFISSDEIDNFCSQKPRKLSDTCINPRISGAAKESGAAAHPGFVDDGNKHCKICNYVVDRKTLICDLCEESFHITCLEQNVKPKDIDDWYCPTCENEPEKCERKKYEYFFSTEKILKKSAGPRIGSNYQADIPIYMGQLSEFAETPLDGAVLPIEEIEEEIWKSNINDHTWEKYWQPAISLPENFEENWLQCKEVTYMKGDICLDGKKARKNIRCGKWRRAPLSEVQTDEWDCSCAVQWDPHHADCAVPQELETTEIQKRLKKSRRARSMF